MGSKPGTLFRHDLDLGADRVAGADEAGRGCLAGPIVAAAVVLHTAMKAMDVDELEVSPWALREGVLLRYIESLSWNEPEA